jgi:hypothetical protein
MSETGELCSGFGVRANYALYFIVMFKLGNGTRLVDTHTSYTCSIEPEIFYDYTIKVIMFD